MSSWYNNRLFKFLIALLLIVANIYLIGKIDYFIDSANSVIAAVFLPIVISILLYYLLRPLHRRLVKSKFPPVLSIVIIFILLFLVVSFIGGSIGVIITQQLQQLLANLPHFIDIAGQKTITFFNENTEFLANYVPLEQIEQELSSYIERAVPFLSHSIITSITSIISIAVILIIVPFLLFYLLKDDEIFLKNIKNLIPERHKENVQDILLDVDHTLANYVIGQSIVASTLGILLYFAYLVIGLDYALTLALFGLITAFIPILGAWIGAIPAVFIGLTVSPIMALKVVFVIVIAQQLEGNLISPQLMGKRMNIHPLVMIILLLASASLGGFVAMLIAVPVYSILKVLVKNGYRLYKISKESACETKK